MVEATNWAWTSPAEVEAGTLQQGGGRSMKRGAEDAVNSINEVLVSAQLWVLHPP